MCIIFTDNLIINAKSFTQEEMEHFCFTETCCFQNKIMMEIDCMTDQVCAELLSLMDWK